MAAGRAIVAVLLAAVTGVAAQVRPPVADRERFFAEVRKRLASNDLIQSRFSYRERTTELRLNPFGRLGTGPVKVFEVYPHPQDDLTYKRLVEEDGRALTAAELARQDREYRRQLSAWQRRLAEEGESERQVRLRKLEEAREKDQVRAREALEMFDFTITGTETWEGQPAIIIDFVPRPDAQPRSREGRVAHAFAGQAWVHEHEYEVMHVKAKAVKDVSFGWGLIAKLHEGATASFTRRRIDGVWLPVETRFEGTGRALLVRRITIEFAREYSAYRPFEPADLPERLGWSR